MEIKERYYESGVVRTPELDNNTRKLFRDLIVSAVGAGLFALINSAGDLGVPPAYIPVVSGVALYVYRELRNRGWLAAVGADPK